MSDNFHIVVCASGGGGNFQALIDARARLGYDISCLITDRPCGAQNRALNHDIPHIALNKRSMKDSFWNIFLESIPPDTDLIVLAGFMPIVPERVCTIWSSKMINTHPSLLPKYGGKGMYGVKVQEAVMAAREEYAGCTVHFVTPEIDGGSILLQKRITVDYAQTPWELGGRVFQEENKLLVQAVEIIMEKKRNG
ncbi:MAG: formyltransferase family protein [Pseudobdellovibrionaceae bacterium]